MRKTEKRPLKLYRETILSLTRNDLSLALGRSLGFDSFLVGSGCDPCIGPITLICGSVTEMCPG